MEITIRTAVEDDFDQLLEFFSEFAAFEELSHKMENSVEQIKAEKENFNCFVAETPQKEIVGYAAWFFCYFTWTGKSLYLDDLYVKPSYRSQGIGKRLINTIIETARSAQCHKIRWQEANWNKPAIDFYKKLGATIDTVNQNCDLSLHAIDQPGSGGDKR